jgi:hypothetical protein
VLKRALALLGFVAVAVSAASSLSCSSSSASSAAQSTSDAGTTSTRKCGVGTITQTDGSCAPADFAFACAPGFATDPSGYGCRDVLPAAPCTGATRAVLGQTTCVPVGDCTAPFPPANATLFVSPSGPTDATHFTTIGAAVSAAAPGAVIAVDSGTYAESVQIPQSVSIIGKCAANVIIEGNAGALVQGIAVNGANPVTVSGVTIHAFFIGLSIETDGLLTLTHSVLDSNQGVGISMEATNGNLTLDDVVVRNTAGSGEPGFGINEQDGSMLKITNSEVTGNHDAALRVSASKASVANSVFSNTLPFTAAYNYGRGLEAQGGSSVDVTASAFIDNVETGIVLSGSTATFSQIVVRDTQPLSNGSFGRAIDAFDNGNFTLDSSTMTDSSDIGIIIVNSTATISKSIMQETKLDSSGDFGEGLVVQENANVTLKGSAILQNHEAGITLNSATLSITGTFVQATQLNGAGTLGYGIVGVNNSSLTIANSEIDSCTGSAVAVASAGGILASSVVSNNAIGIATTDDETLQQVSTAPAQVVQGSAIVTDDTQFISNQTRSVSGDIPLPEAISQ